MAITDVYLPTDPILLSKNQIQVIVVSDLGSGSYPNLQMALRVETWTDAYEFVQPHSDAGGVIFDITDIVGRLMSKGNCLDTDLSDSVAVIGADPIRSLSVFTLFAYEIYGDPPAPAGIPGYLGQIYVINGGINWVAKKYSSFSSLIGAIGTRKFLSWYPTVKRVNPDQPEYLCWLAEYDSAYIDTLTDLYTGAHLNVKIYEHELPSTSLPLLEVTKHAADFGYPVIVRYPVGWTQLGLQAELDAESITRPARRYEVCVMRGTTQLSEKRVFLLDPYQHIDTVYLYFQNSIGGSDTVRFTGEVSETLESDKKFYTGFRMENDPMDPFGILVNAVNPVVESFKANTGWITKKEYDWLKELMYAELVGDVTSGKYIPVKITSKKMEFNRNTDLYRLIIEYRYAFDDVVYTPAV